MLVTTHHQILTRSLIQVTKNHKHKKLSNQDVLILKTPPCLPQINKSSTVLKNTKPAHKSNKETKSFSNINRQEIKDIILRKMNKLKLVEKNKNKSISIIFIAC